MQQAVSAVFNIIHWLCLHMMNSSTFVYAGNSKNKSATPGIKYYHLPVQKILFLTVAQIM
jgi:hypothetical protein